MKYPVRGMIAAPKGKVLIEIDLSQAESWIIAWRAENSTMKEALLTGDIHTTTARYLFKTEEPTKDQRYTAKRVNYAKAYRMQPPTLMSTINKDGDKPPYVTINFQQAKEYSKGWEELYNIRNWWAWIDEKLERTRQLETVYGFRRTFHFPFGEEVKREATAFEPQSTVADHMFGAVQEEVGIPGGLLELHKLVTHEILMTNTSHDSVILECPFSIHKEIALKAASLIERPIIINGESFTIPVDTKVGERWGLLEKLK